MPQYSAIHTDVGLDLMAQAQAMGAQIALADIAVGDGGGQSVVPNAGQTGLVRERYRASIDRIYQPDPVGFPTKFAATMNVPAAVAGFVMREVGLYDAEGRLFVVANTPHVTKPHADDGSILDAVVRVEFIVSNAALVDLLIDPAVVMASQQWVARYLDDRLATLGLA
ncbi:phage tail protein [Pseudooceanicola sp. HF7]|uniref:phage tail protein n=1 Tax=Pseudooceanicola sp. HF7 TaxID=2721560 RepID=UPI0014308629|nr:phage tail protein [Pseudooceanicola sp. HF7]NIZ11091.1 phage tail protein [Pseudooceanicola sp. HF7]